MKPLPILLLATALLAAPGVAPAAETHAPLGYQLLCLQHPTDCQGGGAAHVAATPVVLALLQRVNTAVNRAIRPKADTGPDLWTAAAKSGDCEDYALAKRRELLAAGLPAAALRLAYVRTRTGEGHAVLVVIAGRSRLVLDNLSPAIVELAATGYRLVSMQTAEPDVWS